jgi:hypothetical protein
MPLTDVVIQYRAVSGAAIVADPASPLAYTERETTLSLTFTDPESAGPYSYLWSVDGVANATLSTPDQATCRLGPLNPGEAPKVTCQLTTQNEVVTVEATLNVDPVP